MSKKTFITSDHHFFHRNIIKYCDRPFANEYEMNKVLIENWNKVVTQGDTVIHLGDFFAGLKGRKKQARELVTKLNGSKFLILGNHDHFTKQEYKEMGFDHVDDALVKGKLLFTHYPAIVDERYPHIGTEYSKKLFESNKSEIIFHGHRHLPNPDRPEFKNHINVGVDANNYTPIDLMKLLTEQNLLQYLKS